jgi:cell division protease FtsH
LLPGASETSQATQRLVDDEVKRIVETAHEEATETLSSHRANLDSLVSALLIQETLDQYEAYEAAGLPQNSAAEPLQAPPALP